MRKSLRNLQGREGGSAVCLRVPELTVELDTPMCEKMFGKIKAYP